MGLFCSKLYKVALYMALKKKEIELDLLTKCSNQLSDELRQAVFLKDTSGVSGLSRILSWGKHVPLCLSLTLFI